jgi:hypothetical protein
MKASSVIGARYLGSSQILFTLSSPEINWKVRNKAKDVGAAEESHTSFGTVPRQGEGGGKQRGLYAKGDSREESKPEAFLFFIENNFIEDKEVERLPGEEAKEEETNGEEGARGGALREGIILSSEM